MSERLTEKYKEDFYNEKGKELYDIINKLGKLEDVMEKYGIESMEELDKLINVWKLRDIVDKMENPIENIYKQCGCLDLEQDRDTWKKACELACKEMCKYVIPCPNINYEDCKVLCNRDKDKCYSDYFYQQAQEEMKGGQE